jgi:hypothetical protein
VTTTWNLDLIVFLKCFQQEKSRMQKHNHVILWLESEVAFIVEAASIDALLETMEKTDTLDASIIIEAEEVTRNSNLIT